jgi:MoxR-like ATPase
MKIECPNCHQRLELDEAQVSEIRLSGSTIQCPTCSNHFGLPKAAPVVAHRPESTVQISNDDVAAVQRLNECYAKIRAEIHKVVVGQDAVIEDILTAIFARGHILLIGVPGLAKTLMVTTLSKLLALSFKRVQFTPDLMPSDIIGTDIIQEDPETGRRGFQFIKGPLFTNMLLADEINRTPPKTQAALLEAMQEHRITASGKTYVLDQPFFVLATQNPIEQEGTYPLPEAQLDRFMFNTIVNYPSRDEETEIIKRTTSMYQGDIKQVLTGADIIQLQEIVRRVPVAEHVYQYVTRLVRATRPVRKKIGEEDNPRANTDTTQYDFIQDYVSWGAGPRAGQYLILGAKAKAILHGRYHVTTEDVQAVALPVLRARLTTNFTAESQGITSDEIVRRLLEEIPVEA